jgi:hypothetical protein
MRHYGKTIAHAATGEVAGADAEHELFRQAFKLVPPDTLNFPNRIIDILPIASAMLDGEIEYRRGDYDKSFRRLRDAMSLEDRVPFAEPRGWMLPARHAYAALSLEQGHVEQGHVEQAAHAYAEDLSLERTPGSSHQHPNIIWASHGYHECLGRLGRYAEANVIRRQLAIAVAEADVAITASCFCATGPAASVGKPRGRGYRGGFERRVSDVFRHCRF